MRVYVRNTSRYSNGSLVKCLDVASIEVEPALQGRGLFRSWLRKAEEEAFKRGLSVFIESVLNPFLPEVLARYGYAEDRMNPHCFWKHPSGVSRSDGAMSGGVTCADLPAIP
jgi:GNAT superfamily N-acetyltransferase